MDFLLAALFMVLMLAGMGWAMKVSRDVAIAEGKRWGEWEAERIREQERHRRFRQETREEAYRLMAQCKLAPTVAARVLHDDD